MVGRKLAPIGSALVISTLFAQSAAAIQVDITAGGFTNFIGQSAGTTPSPGCVFPSPFVQGIVAGVQVQAPVCSAASSGLYGPATLTFASTLTSIDFHEAGAVLGNPPRNLLSYVRPSGTQDIPDLGQMFLLGELQFTNGTWFGVGDVNSFHFDITAHSSDPSFGTQTLSTDVVMDIRVDNTPNALPADNADCVYLSGYRVAMGEFCVNEGASGSAGVLGRKGSLIPVAFTNVSGGFILGPAQMVPEPTTLALFGTGLAAVAVMRRRSLGGETMSTLPQCSRI